MRTYAIFIFGTALCLAFFKSQNEKRGLQYQPLYYNEKVETGKVFSKGFLKENFKKAKKNKALTCYHEAGHFVATVLEGGIVYSANIVEDLTKNGEVSSCPSFLNLLYYDKDFVSCSGIASEYIFKNIDIFSTVDKYLRQRGSDIEKMKISRNEALLQIQKAEKKLIPYKRHIEYVAYYLYFYKELNEAECDKLIEILQSDNF